ncbi:unnamed protein product [Durusdinium trenchii]|uniref:Uncharacterized protein n=1 Tax=Durusdinium trenchii TaxID=1381693 RepID=A0ABP0IRS5_9DINO
MAMCRCRSRWRGCATVALVCSFLLQRGGAGGAWIQPDTKTLTRVGWSSPAMGSGLRSWQMRTGVGSTVTMKAVEKELDTEAVGKYLAAIAVQMLAISAFFAALDAVLTSSEFQPPEDWAIFGLFFGMSIRSRLFSPLDNSRPDIEKAAKGEATGGFNDRQMPSWTPPGIFFPIMWILIVAPLRAAASMMLWQQVGHLCDGTILALMLHLSIGDTWNTVNNVERRLGAAVPGVLCVWASALFASYAYYQVVPLAGELLLPTCLWLTVAAALVTDTWRVNNSSGLEPLFPYRSPNATPPSLPDVVSYQHLINAAAATEDEDSVDQWLSEMRNASLSPDVITYTSLMESLVSRGADEQAKRWLQTMVNESVQPNLVMFNVLLASTGRQGDCSRQEQWLQELRRQRLQPDRVSFNTLILGQVRAGELERAEQSLEELRKARCRPDLLSYMPLLDAYARTGDAVRDSFPLGQRQQATRNTRAAATRVMDRDL